MRRGGRTGGHVQATAGEREGPDRIAVRADIQHATVHRHATGAQGIVDAVSKRAAADGRQAGVGVRCRERQHAAAIFGQRAVACADRAADCRVASTTHRQT